MCRSSRYDAYGNFTQNIFSQLMFCYAASRQNSIAIEISFRYAHFIPPARVFNSYKLSLFCRFLIISVSSMTTRPADSSRRDAISLAMAAAASKRALMTTSARASLLTSGRKGSILSMTASLMSLFDNPLCLNSLTHERASSMSSIRSLFAASSFAGAVASSKSFVFSASNACSASICAFSSAICSFWAAASSSFFGGGVFSLPF